jgi:hypothetical protein
MKNGKRCHLLLQRPMTFIRIVVAAGSLFLWSGAASAQEHPCEADNVTVTGGEKAYRKECCAQRPYSALVSVAGKQGIAIKARRTAQEPKPGYFLCTVDFAWENQWESWRRNPANFAECVERVKLVVEEQKRSAPGIFYSTPDIACGDNRDKYLCALGNSWACK